MNGMFKEANSFLPNPKRLQSAEVLSQKSINEFNSKFLASELIGKFVVLRKAKNDDSYGRCPFCTPKTTNIRHFRISDKKGIYKCFECGAGGKKIGFIKRYFNLPFLDSVRFIKRLLRIDCELEIIGKKRQHKFPPKIDQKDREILRLTKKLEVIEKIPRVRRVGYIGEENDDLPF